MSTHHGNPYFNLIGSREGTKEQLWEYNRWVHKGSRMSIILSYCWRQHLFTLRNRKEKKMGAVRISSLASNCGVLPQYGRLGFSWEEDHGRSG